LLRGGSDSKLVLTFSKCPPNVKKDDRKNGFPNSHQKKAINDALISGSGRWNRWNKYPQFFPFFYFTGKTGKKLI
jgi:hypothetical protein